MKLLQSTARIWISSAASLSGSISRRLLIGQPPTTLLRREGASRSCLVLHMTTTTTITSSDNESNRDDDQTPPPPQPPSQFIKSYKLTGQTAPNTNKSGVTVTTKNTNHTLQTDVPRHMGGNDTAPQPVQLLLTAWMGCTQATALFVGRQIKPRGVLLDRLEFTNIQGHRDERGALSLPISQDPPVPSRLFRIEGTIVVYRKGGQAITESEMKLLCEQTELRCPVANMIMASGCQLNVEWVDGSTTLDQDTPL